MKRISVLILCILTSYTMNISAQQNKTKDLTMVIISTDSGNIKLVLYNETKLHRDNFIKLADHGYYNGQLFHRLIQGFMIQGGDPNSRNASKGDILGQGGPGYTIPAEILPKYFHKKGSLAAARKEDNVNPTKASSGSQFYVVQGEVFTSSQLNLMVENKKHKPFTEEEINSYTTTGGSPHLDGGYTVFGELTEGIEVFEKLMKIPVDAYKRPYIDIKYNISILNE